MPAHSIVVYLLRRDLRVSDNPVLHRLASTSDHGFTHLLPVMVLPPDQIETSGFLIPGETSPFPPAKSKVGNFWRCGPHRTKFLAETLWDLKDSLETLQSGLVIRIGSYADIARGIIDHVNSTGIATVSAVWMTDDVSFEEERQQQSVSAVCAAANIKFALIPDEKYFVDDRDIDPDPDKLPDVFTTYRKAQEPLRDKPRPVLPAIESPLPPIPPATVIVPQTSPFQIPDTLEALQTCFSKPLGSLLQNPPLKPDDTESAHPFHGGEKCALDRLHYLIKSGAMSAYADTRNGLLGVDFSTKLSAYLALGCITARQVHSELVKFEDGTDSRYEQTAGYGQAENSGTKAVRLELLWRDYMRLCTKKFGTKLFAAHGFRQVDGYSKEWKTGNTTTANPNQDPPPQKISETIERFLQGDTGMGLIDASQRELYATGYTSNRARQNVASFFAKHLDIDWRYGAEWYECMLVDYDVSSNWANWQYVAGVGNDPRGDARIFNPVKQAFDYDKQGDYVRAWVPEVRGFENIENVFQAWTASPEDLDKLNLTNHIMVTNPLKKIDFTVDRKPKTQRRPFTRGRASGIARGGRRGNGVPGQGRGNVTMSMPLHVPPGHMDGMMSATLPTSAPMYGVAPMGYEPQQHFQWSTPGMPMSPSMHQPAPPLAPMWHANNGAPVVNGGWVPMSATPPMYADYNNIHGSQGNSMPPVMAYRGRGNGRGGYGIPQHRGGYPPN